jgi:hypothetical protein
VESGHSLDYAYGMSSRPPVKLSVLRNIGWKQWDPIGLANIEGGWEDSNFADEYDGYLLEVVGRIRTGEENKATVGYLVWAETDRMGLNLTPSAVSRAEATVSAVREYLATID